MSKPKAGAESQAFIGETRRAEKKSKTAEFCTYLYNSEEGTILGRTPLSWFQITLFYIVFYAGLAAFWVGCLALFLQTIDYKVPTWYGKGTIIGVNPGLFLPSFTMTMQRNHFIHASCKAESYARRRKRKYSTLGLWGDLGAFS